MKNSKYNMWNYWLPALLAVLMTGMGSCKKNATAPPPVITSIRNYVPHPGDSLLHIAAPGQWIVISGNNLKGALQIYFDSVASSFNDGLFSDTSAVVLVPAVIAFPIVPTDKLNTIVYVTTHGQTTFKFNIFPPAPSITSISNENANPGDSVTVYGLNLFFIQNLSLFRRNHYGLFRGCQWNLCFLCRASIDAKRAGFDRYGSRHRVDAIQRQ